MDEHTQSENRIHLQQITRRISAVARTVNGFVKTRDDQISDVIEQIDELRREVKRVAERQDKIAEFIRANVRKQTEESEGE